MHVLLLHDGSAKQGRPCTCQPSIGFRGDRLMSYKSRSMVGGEIKTLKFLLYHYPKICHHAGNPLWHLNLGELL